MQKIVLKRFTSAIAFDNNFILTESFLRAGIELFLGDEKSNVKLSS